MSDCKHDIEFNQYWDFDEGYLISVDCKKCDKDLTLEDLDDYMIVRKPEKYEEYNYHSMMGFGTPDLGFLDIRKKGDEDE